jgi:hypothetical protein
MRMPDRADWGWRHELENGVAKILCCTSMLFMPPDFILAEAMGTEISRRCPAYKNCKKFQCRVAGLSFKENAE